ncbi:MAG: class II glutamine amidotransferase [Neptuniibacter sp.]
MNGLPQILTVYASSPIGVKLEVNDTAVKAFGVSTISEMNHQRWTAQQGDVSALAEFLGKQEQPVEVFSLALYEDEPQDAVDIQPFSRPLKGRHCFFTQQGELPEIHDRNLYSIGHHWPVGCSDQERAFCVLLERTLTLWHEGRPDNESRLALISDYGARLDRLGAHNFSYWDGDYLFAYSSKREEETIPLCFYQLHEHSVTFGDGHRLSINVEDETDVVVVSSNDLIYGLEANPIPPGTVACFKSGKLLDRCEPVAFWTADS